MRYVRITSRDSTIHHTCSPPSTTASDTTSTLAPAPPLSCTMVLRLRNKPGSTWHVITTLPLGNRSHDSLMHCSVARSAASTSSRLDSGAVTCRRMRAR